MATISAPSQSFIGTDVNLSVGFTNQSPSTPGYAPFVDLYLPADGVDGNDGLTYNVGSATYLGMSVTTTVLTFDASGHAVHPYAVDSSGNPIVLDGTPGDQVVVFQLPFGSFTPGQPTATINLSAHLSNLARLGTPLDIKAEGGFALGADPLDDPATDPSIIGSSQTSPLTPTIIQLVKTYLGPEQETATGPNFPEQYLLTVNVAPGQTVTNVDLTDVLPINMQFVKVDSVNGNGSSTITGSNPSTTIPGGTLTEEFDKLVGTPVTGLNTAQVVFTFYIPEYDNTGADVLPLSNGAFAPSTDNANVAGTWTPINTLEASQTVTSSAQDTITDKSIAIQKGVADVVDVNNNGPSPRDTLQYTLNFQISDFFAFQDVTVQDIISDGQAIDPSFTPTISFNQHGNSVSGSFTPSYIQLLSGYGVAQLDGPDHGQLRPLHAPGQSWQPDGRPAPRRVDPGQRHGRS